MSVNGPVVIVGMGEVGRPLYQILSRSYECVGVDLEPVGLDRACSVLHVCYPFAIHDFVGTTTQYIARYRPELTVINSTVLPGTTRQVKERNHRCGVVYSPVRGKHAQMKQEMLRYRKFVAGFNPKDTDLAISHFSRAGFKTDYFRTPEIAELAKLLETTWLGVLVGWAQEVERLALQYDASYEEMNAFIREIAFLPSHIFPGVIRGHCVMANIELLRNEFNSKYLDAVVESNQNKSARDSVTQETNQ